MIDVVVGKDPISENNENTRLTHMTFIKLKCLRTAVGCFGSEVICNNCIHRVILDEILISTITVFVFIELSICNNPSSRVIVKNII